VDEPPKDWVYQVIDERYFPSTTGLMPVAPISVTTQCSYLSSVDCTTSRHGVRQASRKCRIILGLFHGIEFYTHNEQQPELWML